MTEPSASIVRPTLFDSVERWADRDFGEDLRNFLEEICYSDLASYAQLIHHKDIIIQCLLRHLADRSLSLPAFCDFCSAIATDLRDDFHTHFWQIFDAISKLVLASKGKEKCSDNELECALRAMEQIVRINFRFVSARLKQLFSRLLPLFAFPSDVRLRFISARTFSFVFLKAPFPHKLAKFLLVKCFSDCGHLRDGLSLFFFDAFLGVEENEAKLEELIDAFVVPIFEMSSESELRRFSITFLSDVFRKSISDKNLFVSTGIVAKLHKRFESAVDPNELQTLSEWLLLWVNAKRHSHFVEENAKKLLPLVVTKIELASADCAELFEQYLQLISALLLSLPPSSDNLSSVFAVLANFGTDSCRLPALLRCLARLRPLPLFRSSVMDLVDRVASSLLASVPADFGTVSQQQLQLLRELLIFYKNILTDLPSAGDHSLFSSCQSPAFCVRLHLPIRHFVVAVLHNPSDYPSDFFDFALLIWPHLWLVNEKPEGSDAINYLVIQSIRKGTKQRLTEKETERLWNGTYATLLKRE
ncbi:hypothetical protein niasHT_001594 [Heterodera trifolii]|uniref:MMS19 nucleotide excision repair protein n=1 Tax=Heterodera trifolii TaxID=157864 RepID=A0ABD2MB58_9BILA